MTLYQSLSLLSEPSYIPIEEQTIDTHLWQFVKETQQVPKHLWQLIEATYHAHSKRGNFDPSKKPSFLCILQQLKLASKLELNNFYKKFDYESIKIGPIDPWYLQQLRYNDSLSRWLYNHEIIPLCCNGSALTIACSWPHKVRHCQELFEQLQTANRNINHVKIFYTTDSIKYALSHIRHYNLIDNISEFFAENEEKNTVFERKLINFNDFDGDEHTYNYPPKDFFFLDNAYYFDHILNHATLHGATDVHWIPQKNWVEISMRCAGHLFFLPSPLPLDSWQQLVGYLKIKSSIDIGQDFTPQTGLWKKEIAGEDYNCRVSSHPTIYGTSVAIRLLAQKILDQTVEGLGFTSSHCLQIEHAIQKDQGIILLCGATGSGKTTTLYTILKQYFSPLNPFASTQTQKAWRSTKNIMTLEDPVEYHLPNTRQTSVGTMMSYEDGLASILRHDPDIIVVGEIRTKKVAQLALHASRSGHLVFATIHGKNPKSAIERLRYLVGKEHDYNIENDVILCIHQELNLGLVTEIPPKNLMNDFCPLQQYHQQITKRNLKVTFL